MNLISLRRSLFHSAARRLSSTVAASASSFSPSLSSAQEEEPVEKDDRIYLKRANSSTSLSSLTRDEESVTMPMSFMTGSVVGKRFYKEVTTRLADDGNGWTVMLDYRTLKTPSKRPLKLPNHALAKAIAAEWEYQQADGIRPFTMPLMKLACTALERVPLTRITIMENLLNKFHQDLVFCQSPGDTDINKGVQEKQVEKIGPILEWVQSKFGFKPKVFSTFFGCKQEDGLVKAVENVLKNTTDCELAAIDALAAASHSLVIPLAIFYERFGIKEAVELIRLEEDLQVDRWGLVEGGHDVDIADIRVQISSAFVFLRMSYR
ncbi:hypothetical protein HPP92_020467 [Vanilla planifolia]|uniref:ATP synthase mitochondrial F1 complex assembly factor 2 n=1 Tax=Vanilla planifolia TaxID=51239 RepID=A0A835Q473_VANPL|nr:hypothetical protein HPP92_020467 [Vanilla planifolia]